MNYSTLPQNLKFFHIQKIREMSWAHSVQSKASCNYRLGPRISYHHHWFFNSNFLSVPTFPAMCVLDKSLTSRNLVLLSDLLKRCTEVKQHVNIHILACVRCQLESALLQSFSLDLRHDSECKKKIPLENYKTQEHGFQFCLCLY